MYADGEIRLLVSGLEYTRAITDSDADSVRKFSEFGFAEKAAEHERARVGPLTTAAFLAEYGIDSIRAGFLSDRNHGRPAQRGYRGRHRLR
jgi:Xaa-Pro aminopeptidase